MAYTVVSIGTITEDQGSYFDGLKSFDETYY